MSVNPFDQKSVNPFEQKSVNSPTSTSYKVSGQLHSWKSGDIKLLIKSEEKENKNQNLKSSPPRYEPISSVFDEKNSRFEATTINVGGEKFTKFESKKSNYADETPTIYVEKSPRFGEKSSKDVSSVIPTSSQLVKNVEETFKNASKEKETVDGKEKLKKVFLTGAGGGGGSITTAIKLTFVTLFIYKIT